MVDEPVLCAEQEPCCCLSRYSRFTQLMPAAGSATADIPAAVPPVWLRDFLEHVSSLLLSTATCQLGQQPLPLET